MELFHRTKQSRVEWDEARSAFVVSIDMVDRFHDMGVRVVFAYPELVIQEVEPRMERTPYPVCPTALRRAAECVGMKVQAGLQLMMNRSIGGAEGCTHVTQLVLDACHAAVQGLLAIQSARGGETVYQIPADEKIAFLEARGLALRDSCTAYSSARRAQG
jgi:Protein of unknown function (DUF2889)